MATSSRMTYQVFLSFRGPDTRQGLVDVLYHELTREGIHVFRDDEEIRKGEDIGGEILKAISESKIFVPIFSRGYASSKWCLIELSKMFESMEASPESGKKILPVFYDVRVDDVKLKTGMYSEALLKLREKFSPDTVQQWEEALKKAGKIKGWEVNDTGYAEVAEDFARDLSIKLKVKHKFVTEYLVQRDDQVEALMKLLDTEASDVWFVGIHRMGGIGKTTLAKIVFNKLCDLYEHCSFLVDVRESSRRNGIVHLQKQLLGNLGSTTRDIMDADDGIRRMRETLQHKRVLIVLDDVDDKEQLRNLARDASLFGKGSRIIVTTRNQDILGRGFQAFEVIPMKTEEALQLFSMHAFDKDSPPNDCLSLSHEAVESTGRLPLALEVIGSHLGNMPHEKWAKAIKSLKEVPHNDVEEKLMISYKALKYGAKQIFLDIACFFIGHDKTLPMYMWEACGFNAKRNLQVLIHMSLVKIVVEKRVKWREVKEKKLWMHDLLRDLGRKIIHDESSENGVNCNRLWIHEDAVDVLQEEEGKENVEMLRLCNPDNDPTELYKHYFSEEEFSGFRKLRYLECHRARITGDWSRLLPELRWISGVYCSMDMDFTRSSLNKLAVLELSDCDIDEDWSGWSQVGKGNKLKVLDLSCAKFRKTPDLSNFQSLERLILVDCARLVEIDPSIGKLKDLKFLNVSGCKSLKGFPNELCSLSHLEVVLGYDYGELFASSKVSFFSRGLKNQQRCLDHHYTSEVELFYLSQSIGNIRPLLTLVLHGAPITELPESIGRLLNLRLLSLCNCSSLERLPHSLADIKSLVVLRLSNTKISELPQRVGQLVKLEILNLSGCRNVKKLPDSMGDMESLVELDLSYSGITELPAAIGVLKRLETICASWCTSLAEIPSTIGGCTSLRVLDLGYCRKIKKLPDSVGDLRMLAELHLYRSGISELPDTIGNLEELRVVRNYDTTWGLPTSIVML